jgi:hypothetical protein
MGWIFFSVKPNFSLLPVSKYHTVFSLSTSKLTTSYYYVKRLLSVRKCLTGSRGHGSRKIKFLKITIPGMNVLEAVWKWLLLQTGLYKRIRCSFEMPGRGNFKELLSYLRKRGHKIKHKQEAISKCPL